MPMDVIEVTITTELTPVTRQGFGMPFILSTEQAQDYEVYTSASDVSTAFGSDSNTAKMARAIFRQSPRPPRIAISGINYTAGTDPVSDLTTELDSQKDKGNFDWYFLTCTEQGIDEIKELASYASSNEKFFVGSYEDKAILDEADLNNDRTVILISQEHTEYPGEGLMGVIAPQDPGSVTWAYQQVNGANLSGFGTAELMDILDKNGNVIIKKSGMEYTLEGKTVSGDYADVTRTSDFLKARIEENVLSATVNAGKIPFTTEGINIIVSAIESAFKTVVNTGGIAVDADGEPEYEIQVPSIDDISETDRANRVLPNVEAEARIAGATHKTKVNVKLGA